MQGAEVKSLHGLFEGHPLPFTNTHGRHPDAICRSRCSLGHRSGDTAGAGHKRLDRPDEAALPTDPEFRSAFVSYMEWGSRIALANSQPGAQPPPRMPVPHWDWGTAGPPPSVSLGSGPPPNSPPQPSAAGQAPGWPTDPPSFERDIRPLFTDRDRTAMRWAFDLGDVDAVSQHADAILDQLRATAGHRRIGGWAPCLDSETLATPGGRAGQLSARRKVGQWLGLRQPLDQAMLGDDLRGCLWIALDAVS
jgi:hypothetical protein